MKYRYICEVCGKSEILSPEEAYLKGWDYPPFMGMYGVVSARTCPDCPIIHTAWAALMMEHKTYMELNDKQKETILRIQGEPGNMMPEQSEE